MPNEMYREEFSTLGEFLQAVAMAAVSGSPDTRLEFAAVATGLGEKIPSEGGIVVPESFAEVLWQATLDTGQILSRCGRQPITRGDKISIPAIDESSRADGSRFGGVSLGWVDEGATPTATKPKYRGLTLKPKKLLGVTYASDELLADAPALESWLTRTFGLEASFVIEDSIVNGTGIGRPLGILNSGALITVDPESGQAVQSVTNANLIAMAARLWGPSHRTAIWLTGNEAYKQLMNGTFGVGVGPIVTTSPGGTRTILQMPVALCEYTQPTGDTGDVILADFSQYLIGEIAPEFLSSLHVRFVEDEAAFRFRWRIDGQPAWKSPLTPKNSTITESAFIALAARL